jgi:hypothetical protein
VDRELDVEQNFHVSEDRLEQYVLGRLDSVEVVPLEEHLVMCALCQERLDGVEDLAIGLRQALETQQVTSSAAPKAPGWFDWLRRPGFSMAAGLAALILVIAVFSNNRTNVAPSASLVLTSIRGEMPQTVPAQHFDLTLADAPREGGPFRVEVLNAMGGSIWSGLATAGPNGVEVTEPRRLENGDYFVRLYTADGKVLREYGFKIRR